MSSLVEQIIQRLELLPEQALQKVLAMVTSLLETSISPIGSDVVVPTSAASSADMPNLKKHGNVWVVKASQQQPLPDYHEALFQVREERIDKLMQW
ncbi:MAG: hypothetical protein ACFB14_15070 [Leptolyngbyaceae cyanobacterium]